MPNYCGKTAIFAVACRADWDNDDLIVIFTVLQITGQARYEFLDMECDHPRGPMLHLEQD